MIPFMRIGRAPVTERRTRKLMRLWYHLVDDVYVTLLSVGIAVAVLILFVVYVRARMPR